ncbi:hypothetical protein N510_003279 [Firmicutes bacterium ASF500]|nr:hypothetical protein N510_003279 [Firmicutes bacterium ASF500]
MKKTKQLICIIAAFSIIALNISVASASTKASDQISVFGMDVSTSKGSIDIEFSVMGVDTVDKLGCQSIYIYKQVGNSWYFVENVLEDEPGMSSTNTFTHTNLICRPGTAGVKYKVIVTIFAENSAGRDSRGQIFYVTGR